jgi:hypothetical protein
MVQANLRDMSDAEIDRWARRLAKYGVNLVRMQMSDFFTHHVKGDRAAFDQQLERLHYVVAALKREGIYSYFGHLYWHTSNPVTEEIYPGFGKGQNAIALLIFSQRFQDWYKEYLRAVMSPVNPYTGVPLAEGAGRGVRRNLERVEPAVLDIQPEELPRSRTRSDREALWRLADRQARFAGTGRGIVGRGPGGGRADARPSWRKAAWGSIRPGI